MLVVNFIDGFADILHIQMKFHNSFHADTHHPEEKLDVAQDGDKPGGNKRLDLNVEPWFEMQLLAFQQLPVLSYEFSVHVFRFTKSPAVTPFGGNDWTAWMCQES